MYEKSFPQINISIKTVNNERIRGENTLVTRKNKNVRFVLSTFDISSVRVCTLFYFIKLFVAVSLLKIF